MLEIYTLVTKHKLPNYRGARIPLPTNLNINRWRQATEDHHDKQVADFLAYGWPVSYRGPVPTTQLGNHASAKAYTRDIRKYTDLEVKEGAMLGPFPCPTFYPWSHISPLLTRPKKQSEDRRVILDLSWPQPPGHSVNGGTPSHQYLDQDYKLKLPSAMDLAALIVKAGRGAHIYGVDIARAYRQLPLDPCDWPLVGLKTQEGFFTDLSLPFGLRWAAMACQRTMDVVAHLSSKQGATVIVYIDDLAGAASTQQEAHRQFDVLRQVIEHLGLQEAKHKASPPSQSMVWLGLLFDTINMTVSIPQGKLDDITATLQDWQQRATAHKTQLQSLLGSLFHIAQCVPPARLFLNRMLATLRECPQVGRVVLGDDFRKDMAWFQKYMAVTNGVYLLDQDFGTPVIIQVDSCQTGAGGICDKQAYHVQYSEELLKRGLDICHLECLNALAAVRLWGPVLKHRNIQLQSDSATAVAVLQAGRGRDPLLQAAARELWLLSARHQFHLSVTHVPGEQLLTTADALSRFHLGPQFRNLVDTLIEHHGVTIMDTQPAMFKPPLDW